MYLVNLAISNEKFVYYLQFSIVRIIAENDSSKNATGSSEHTIKEPTLTNFFIEHLDEYAEAHISLVSFLHHIHSMLYKLLSIS